MATALNSAGGVSAASEAFRKCSAELTRGIQDPELLAWELYSDDVVSETIVDEVSVVGLSSVQRKTRLLNAVSDQIAVDPAKFQNLLLALRKQAPLKDVADKLETIFNNCGMYAGGDCKCRHQRSKSVSATTTNRIHAGKCAHIALWSQC